MNISVYLEASEEFKPEKLIVEAYNDSDLWEILAKRGINKTNNEASADLLFLPVSGLDTRTTKNKVALERVDGCQFSGRSGVDDDSVIKWVKMYRYADWDVYNLPTHSRRIFTRHLSNSIPLSNKPQPKCFDKVMLGLSFLHYMRHLKHRDFAETVGLNQDRDIDVFFAGTTEYKSVNKTTEDYRLVTDHRESLLKQLESYTNLKSILAAGRSFPIQEYMGYLQNSKITVSPWGWGEACFRDYEAIIHGCEVIKPRSYEMESNPSIYNQGYVTYCKPDWSDLEIILQQRLNSWDTRIEQRTKFQENIVQAMSTDYKADIVENIVTSAVENI